MGDIADMMLDGTLCEGCGVYMEGDGFGVPRRCSSCRRDERAEQHKQTLAQHQQQKKVPCSVCGRKVKAIGMANHMKDAHPLAVQDATPTKGRTE